MLTPHAEGVVLEVKALPGSKRDELRGVQNNALKVCVTQAPEKGKANKAIRKVLADAMKLRASQVELLSGETSSQKKFLLRGVDMSTIQETIEHLLETATK